MMKTMSDNVSSSSGARPLRFSVLQPADVERIHELSLKVLEETGVILHYPPARKLLRDHGASLDEARQLVRIPRHLVEEALRGRRAR
jgi:trimethylamine--corrinoid protein Co-methyltransferase